MRGAVCIFFDITNGIWITTASKELSSSGGPIRRTGNDIVDVNSKVLLDEGTFRMVEMKNLVYSLALRLYLDFKQCQKVSM